MLLGILVAALAWLASVRSGRLTPHSSRLLLATGYWLLAQLHACSLALPHCPQLYSPAGRHLTAPLKLGAGIARLACDSAWRLLALTTSGAVRLFDAEALRSLLNVSLEPLLEDGCTGEWLFCGVLQPPC